MSMTMTAAPATEPVTLAEAKAHLRVDGEADDSYIASLIVTSRLQIEAALGLALVTQSWRLQLDEWPPDHVIEMPMRPLAAINAISVATGDSTSITLSLSAYIVDGTANPARISFTSLPPAPGAIARGIAIDFTAGFGSAASVPRDIRHALLLLVAHWFEHREPAASGAGTAIPDAVSTLLAPYRMVRL